MQIDVTSISDTGRQVTDRHLGGNAVSGPNIDETTGAASASFEQAVSALDVTHLRVPAGQTEAFFADGLIVDGALPAKLTTFMDWARDTYGGAVSVSVVIPSNESFASAADMALFAELLTGEYGELVTGFEFGNEYWSNDADPGGQSRESEYGERASTAAVALQEGMDRVGTDADILIQTANPAGQGSSWNPDHPDGLAGNRMEPGRWEGANQDIIDELSAEAIAAIDGVIHHYYWTSLFANDPDNSRAYRMEWHDETWETALGKDLEMHVTEWNVARYNEDLTGMRSAPSMVVMFGEMIDAGVDAAQVWPLQHNTRNHLAGRTDDPVETDDESGLVTNSVGGALFDMMSDALSGKSRLDLGTPFAGDDLRLDAYGAHDEITLYVSSNTDSAQQVTLDILEHFAGITHISGLILGYDPESADGIRTNNGGAAQAVTIDGEAYYLNEDDVDARITSLDFGEMLVGQGVVFDLKPYEVAQITLDTSLGWAILTDREALPGAATQSDDRRVWDGFAPDAVPDDAIIGSETGEFLSGGRLDNYIDGKGGDDTLKGWKGVDTIFGGDGDDSIVGGHENDLLYGDAGADTLAGGTGWDMLSGGAGNDSLRGEDGSDILYGEDGDDRLEGSHGDDYLDGGAGSDDLRGAWGADTLLGGDGDDVLRGGDDGDLMMGGLGADEAYGQQGDDTLHGNEGDDRLVGGAGDDEVYGGSGNDTIAGNTGADTLDGGAGDDTYTGGSEADVFAFGEGHGADQITDFETGPGLDRIDLSGIDDLSGYGDLAGGSGRMQQSGADVVIDTGEGSIRLTGTSLGDLGEDHFVF